MHLTYRIARVVALSSVLLGSSAQVTTSCSPLNGTCPNDKGLASSFYSIDFTSVKDVPSEWALATDETVTFGPAGAAFSFEKRYDAPTMRTNFNFFFGRIEYVMKAAPGTGIISSMVLLSDDLDEIDWEFRGSIANSVQTNYFGKGFTGTYNRSTTVPLSYNPQEDFHTYAIDWSPSSLTWYIDGKPVRTLDAADAGSQYPQTPMKVSLSLWDGGDPSTNPGTVQWAGGYTPLPPPEPYTMYVHSVKIWNSNPGQQYQYGDISGSWQSIKVINTTTASNSSTAVRSTTRPSLGNTTSLTKVSGTASPGTTKRCNTTSQSVTSTTTQVQSKVTGTLNLVSSTTKGNSTVTLGPPKSMPSGSASSTFSRNTTTSPCSSCNSTGASAITATGVPSGASLPALVSKASATAGSTASPSGSRSNGIIPTTTLPNVGSSFTSTTLGGSVMGHSISGTTAVIGSTPCSVIAAGEASSSISVPSPSHANLSTYGAAQGPVVPSGTLTNTPTMPTASSSLLAAASTTHNQAPPAPAVANSTYPEGAAAVVCFTCAPSALTIPLSTSAMAFTSSPSLNSATAATTASRPDYAPQNGSSGNPFTGDSNSPIHSESAVVATCSTCAAPPSSTVLAPLAGQSTIAADSTYPYTAAASTAAGYPTHPNSAVATPATTNAYDTPDTDSSDTQSTSNALNPTDGDSVTDIGPSSTSTGDVDSTSTALLTQTITATLTGVNTTTVLYPFPNSTYVFASGSMVSISATGATGTGTGTGYYQPTSSPIAYASSGIRVGLSWNVVLATAIAGTMAVL